VLRITVHKAQVGGSILSLLSVNITYLAFASKHSNSLTLDSLFRSLPYLAFASKHSHLIFSFVTFTLGPDAGRNGAGIARSVRCAAVRQHTVRKHCSPGR
jgi:hypothetical protein